MASLRELLDKQAAEKAAQVPPARLPPVETKPAVPNEPPKKRSVLDRIGGGGSPEYTGTQMPVMKTSIPDLEAALAAGPAQTIIVTVPAPKQDLPQSSIEELRKNLDYLAENIDQKNLVGQVVRTIGTQLYENPQFSSCMKDTDFDLLVRGLRSSYKMAARRRVELGEKREEKREDVLELESMMKDLGVSLKF